MTIRDLKTKIKILETKRNNLINENVCLFHSKDFSFQGDYSDSKKIHKWRENNRKLSTIQDKIYTMQNKILELTKKTEA